MYRYPIISFVVLTLAGTLASDAFADGNFQESCSNSRIVVVGTDNRLVADCKRRDGSINTTSIHLDPFIANENGSLVWSRKGGFGATCSLPSIEGSSLRALCMKDGGRNVSSLNLGVNIANYDGILEYIGPGP